MSSTLFHNSVAHKAFVASSINAMTEETLTLTTETTKDLSISEKYSDFPDYLYNLAQHTCNQRAIFSSCR